MKKSNTDTTNKKPKSKSKNNLVFDIVKIKKHKNSKNNFSSENQIYNYNILEKKYTNFKKILNYHEISDKKNLLSNKNITLDDTFNETNYTIKAVFLDRHVRTFTNYELSSLMTLDLIEKEEKSKLIDIYLIKTNLISSEFKENENNKNFLRRKTLQSGSNNPCIINTDLNLNLNNSENYEKEKNKILQEINNYIYSITISPTYDPDKNFISDVERETSKLKLKLTPNNEIAISKTLAALKGQTININNNWKNSFLSSNTPKNENEKKNVKQPVIFEDFFDKFVKKFPEDYDCFEYEVIKVLSSMMNFSDFSNIFLFLYDDLKKLRDIKTLELLKNKLKDCLVEDLDFLKKELRNYFEYRTFLINYLIGKNGEDNTWTDEKIITEIFLTSLISEKMKNHIELDLTQNYIMGINIQIVISALKFNNYIRKLVLNSNKIGEEGMYLLGRVLHYNSKIIDLDISLNFLSDLSLGLFIKGIGQKFVNLQKLNLSNNISLTSNCGYKIKDIIELSPNLRFLNISKINIEKGILKVFEALLVNKNLEEIVCISTQLNDEILSNLALFFNQNNDIRLKKINLSENKFSGNSPKDLFYSLRKNKYLKELILYNCKMENFVVDEFCDMLCINDCLEKVTFFNNNLNCFDNLKKVLSVKKQIQLKVNDNNKSKKEEKINNIPLADLDNEIKENNTYTKTDRILNEQETTLKSNFFI